MSAGQLGQAAVSLTLLLVLLWALVEFVAALTRRIERHRKTEAVRSQQFLRDERARWNAACYSAEDDE